MDTSEQRGIEIRISAIAALISEQEIYLAQLKLRKELLQNNLVTVRRREIKKVKTK